MTKAKPCRHTRGAIVKYEAVPVHVDAAGELVSWAPGAESRVPEQTRWGVLCDWKCARCGDVILRFARKGFGEATARKALARYGVKPAALPAPPNYKPPAYKVPPQEGLWPFPSVANPLVPLKEGR